MSDFKFISSINQAWSLCLLVFESFLVLTGEFILELALRGCCAELIKQSAEGTSGSGAGFPSDQNTPRGPWPCVRLSFALANSVRLSHLQGLWPQRKESSQVQNKSTIKTFSWVTLQFQFQEGLLCFACQILSLFRANSASPLRRGLWSPKGSWNGEQAADVYNDFYFVRLLNNTFHSKNLNIMELIKRGLSG